MVHLFEYARYMDKPGYNGGLLSPPTPRGLKLIDIDNVVLFEIKFDRDSTGIGWWQRGIYVSLLVTQVSVWTNWEKHIYLFIYLFDVINSHLNNRMLS